MEPDFRDQRRREPIPLKGKPPINRAESAFGKKNEIQTSTDTDAAEHSGGHTLHRLPPYQDGLVNPFYAAGLPRRFQEV